MYWIAQISGAIVAAYMLKLLYPPQIVEATRTHERTLSQAQARERAMELLRKVGVPRPDQRLAMYSFQLSGGLRQRAMIAMALACNPKVLIADEPTTALDVTIQAQILALLADIRARLGMSLLFITHDLGIVRRIADVVCVMNGGKIVEQGPVEQVFTAPKHPYTRDLLAAASYLRTLPNVDPSRVGSIEYDIRSRAGSFEPAAGGIDTGW